MERSTKRLEESCYSSLLLFVSVYGVKGVIDLLNKVLISLAFSCTSSGVRRTIGIRNKLSVMCMQLGLKHVSDFGGIEYKDDMFFVPGGNYSKAEVFKMVRENNFSYIPISK